MKIIVPIYMVKQLDKQIQRIEDTIKRRQDRLKELKSLRVKLEPSSDRRYTRKMKDSNNGDK